jgi:hypothetical protein
MTLSKNSIDLHWTSDGDLRLGENEDLGKVNYVEGRVGKQIILKRLQSRKGDWANAKDLGANLFDYAGMPNTRETGQLIQSSVIQSLIEDGTFSPNSLEVEVYPTSEESIAVAMAAKIPFSSNTTFLQVDYDLRSNSIIPRAI